MHAILSIALVSAAASFLAACSGPQTTSSVQAPAVKTAANCSPGEMVYAAGSRLKQPCGSVTVSSGSSLSQ